MPRGAGRQCGGGARAGVRGPAGCPPPCWGQRVVGDNAEMEPTHPPGGDAPRRDIVLLGSTGSIGTQAADIVRRNPGRFRVAGLAAGGGNPALLASQALEFGAEVVAVASESGIGDLRQALQAEAARVAPGGARQLPKILAGADAVAEV